MHLKGLATVLASSRNSCLFHGAIIAHISAARNEGYFDIAVKRIREAQMQARLL